VRTAREFTPVAGLPLRPPQLQLHWLELTEIIVFGLALARQGLTTFMLMLPG
jgi:hypothetical protein